MAVNPVNIGWNQVNKKVTKASLSAIKTAKELTVPKTPVDIALTLAGGTGGRAVAGIAKKGAKYVAKIYRNTR